MSTFRNKRVANDYFNLQDKDGNNITINNKDEFQFLHSSEENVSQAGDPHNEGWTDEIAEKKDGIYPTEFVRSYIRIGIVSTTTGSNATQNGSLQIILSGGGSTGTRASERLDISANVFNAEIRVDVKRVHFVNKATGQPTIIYYKVKDNSGSFLSYEIWASVTSIASPNRSNIMSIKNSIVTMDNITTTQPSGLTEVDITPVTGENIRKRASGDFLTSVGSGSTLGSVATSRTLKKGDIIELEVNDASGHATVPKIVKVTLGFESNIPSVSTAMSTGFNTGNSNIYSASHNFSISYLGDTLYFNYKYEGQINVSTTSYSSFILYVGNVWYLGNVDSYSEGI